MTKTITLSLAAALALLIVGCGGDNGGGGSAGSGGSGGSTGGNGGSHGPVDMAGGSTGGFMCGNMSCGAGTQCCVTGTTPTCATSCADGGFTASCGGPSDCMSGYACCIHFDSKFAIQQIGCASQDSCVPDVLKGLDRACTTDADCTAGTKTGTGGTTLTDCCTLTSVGRKACFNKTFLQGNPPPVTGWTCP